MKVIFNWFQNRMGEKKQEKKKAHVFVDYEHWYISLEKNYHVKPNIKKLTDELNETYNIAELVFFGDFSSAGMQNEMHKIRGFTNKIVETKNGSAYYKKDFTDFIMLDHIYQSALKATPEDTFIIFTGDGHFTSVALFLKNTCRIEVGIYGIRNAFSGQLKQAASFWKELPDEEEILLPYCQMLLANLNELTEDRKNARPSFWKTVEAVSTKYGIPQEQAKKALEYLLQHGYLYQDEEQYNYRKLKVLRADWKKIEQDGIYRAGMQIRMAGQDRPQTGRPAVGRQ